MARGRRSPIKIKKPGSLRRALGVKKGQKVPISKARRAAKGKGITAKRARFFLNVLRRSRHK